jgi:hypothetical protein
VLIISSIHYSVLDLRESLYSVIINAVGTVYHHRQSSSHPRTARDAEFSTQLAVNQSSNRSVSEMAEMEHFVGSSSSATVTEDIGAIEFVFEANIGRSNLNTAVGSSGSFADGRSSSSGIPHLAKSAQLQLAAGHQLFLRAVSIRKTAVRDNFISLQEGRMPLAAAGHHLEKQHIMEEPGICSWYSRPSFVSGESIVKLQLVQTIIIDCVRGKTVVQGALQKLQLAQ